MKYNIGDKVKIRKDLIVGERYEGLTYYSNMKKEAENIGDNGATIIKAWIDSYGRRLYEFGGCGFIYSEAMIEGLAVAEPTDREKFEGWMRKLSSLPYDNEVWHAFNYIVTTEPDRDGYEDKLKIVSDFLFAKKMTKAEIEKELGCKIEIVEGE